MKKFSLCLLVACLITAAGTRSARAQFDQVYPLKGAPTRGAITNMSPTEITIDANSVERKLPVNEIQRVIFDGEPNELRRARDAVVQGRLEDARAELASLDAGSVNRDYIQQEIKFYKAYLDGKLALSGGGDKAGAVRAMLGFVKDHPNNYHFYQAAELLGDLAVALGSYENAVKYYASIAAAPWPEYQLRATVLEARALAAQKKFDEALQKFETVINAGTDDANAARYKRLATVGKASCLAEKGQPQEGIALLEELIAKNDPQDNELFGRAYNSLGLCYRRADKSEDALLAYLHVDLLFYNDAEAHAEALFNLAQLWTEVNKSDRAVRARSLLQSRYAGSVWAKQL